MDSIAEMAGFKPKQTFFKAFELFIGMKTGFYRYTIGKAIGADAALQWPVAQEISLSYYEVEKKYKA